MTDATMPREEAERLLALCEDEQQARENVRDPESMPRYLRLHAEFNHAALDALPHALREVLRLQEELVAWRAMMPDIDRLSALLGVCEGNSPLGAAAAEIERLRRKGTPLTRARLRDLAVAAADEWALNHARPDHIELTHGALLNLANVIEKTLRRALDAAGIKEGQND